VSRSLNRATLIGNVGQDPEVRSTANGGRVATFSVATSNIWNDQSGTRQEKTEWHRCVAWNQGRQTLADVVERYVKKGEKVFVEGEINYRQWQDKDGQTRYTTEIKVRELILLGGRAGSGEEEAPRRSAPKGGAPTKAAGGASDDFADFPGALQDEDDDLPF
jgi:single-strand DNA-binding protein